MIDLSDLVIPKEQAHSLRFEAKERSLRYIPLSELSVSEFNPRRSRSAEAIARLAERMKRNGFEATRAVWVYENGRGVEVFAGGTRLEAARMAGLEEIPAWVHEGYSEDELVRLADEDNENDEYHERVPLVDVWADYKRLYERGWTQERIAKAKGVSQTLVALRLKMADFPQRVLDIITTAGLNEGQARELLRCNNCAPHLPEETALLNILDNVLTRTDKPTARHFAAEVAARNELVAYCRATAAELGEWAERFLEEIDWKAHTIRHAQRIEARIRAQIAEEARRKAEEAESAAREAEVKEDVWLYRGDAMDVLPTLDDGSVALVIADPPYNTTEHEWDRIGSDEEYLAFLAAWLRALSPKLAAGYHLFVFCDPDYQAAVEMLLKAEGYPLKSRLIWEYRNLVKGRTASDKFIENWQMCFHCGTHALNFPAEWDARRFMVQNHARPQSNFEEGSHHPTPKPVDLLKLLVAFGSREDDLVLDPFAGGGSSGQACRDVGGRRCVLIEREDEFCRAIEARLGVVAHEY